LVVVLLLLRVVFNNNHRIILTVPQQQQQKTNNNNNDDDDIVQTLVHSTVSWLRHRYKNKNKKVDYISSQQQPKQQSQQQYQALVLVQQIGNYFWQLVPPVVLQPVPRISLGCPLPRRTIGARQATSVSPSPARLNCTGGMILLYARFERNRQIARMDVARNIETLQINQLHCMPAGKLEVVKETTSAPFLRYIHFKLTPVASSDCTNANAGYCHCIGIFFPQLSQVFQSIWS
jgi:hypothetical protein